MLVTGTVVILLAAAGAGSGAGGGRSVLLPPAHGVYHAVFPGFRNEDVVTAAPLRAFARAAGKPVAWAEFSQNWWQGLRFPAAAVATIRAAGAVPYVRLMPRSSYAQNVAEPRFTLERIAAGTFDRALAAWAAGARDSGGPVLVEFGPEVNGFWFPWNGRWHGGASGPARFRAAYRHVIEVFRRERAENVTWFFHVNAWSNPIASWNSPAAYYPGDAYVDWIGVSVYGATHREDIAGWPTFRQIMARAYPQLAALSPTKPLAILELGVGEDPGRPQRKAAWIREAYAALAAGTYPRVKAVSWWTDRLVQADGFVADLAIDSSPASLAAYRHAVADPRLVGAAGFSAD